METDYRIDIETANELFEERQYRDCANTLNAALTELEKQEHWLLCSALLARRGHCHQALGNYALAEQDFRRAKVRLMKLSSDRYTQGEIDILDGFIEQALVDTAKDDELERIRYRCAEICLDQCFDEADLLASSELDKAMQQYGERDWLVAGMKMVQAMCKVQRMRGGSRPDECPEVDEQMLLLDECRQLYKEVIEIVEENGLHACWLADKAREMDEGLQLPEPVGETDGDGEWNPDTYREWTPDSDGECDGAEHAAGAPPPALPTFNLRSWLDPFPNFNIQVPKKELVAQFLSPIDQLFMRHEYRQCFGLLDALIEGARERNDIALVGLTLVLAARCHRGLGQYDDAIKLLTASQSWMREVPRVGEKMVQQVQAMTSDCENEALILEQLHTIQKSVAELTANEQFTEGAELCSQEWRRRSAALGADHWLCVALKLLFADCLLAKATKARAEAAVGATVNQTALLDEVRELLANACDTIERQGHDAYWVKGSLCQQLRDRLNELD